MSSTCIHCGKQLGSRTLLCFSCESAGINPEDEVDLDESVLDKVEDYFLLSAVRCSDCGDLHGQVDTDDGVLTAADFDIDSISEWESEMEAAEAWLRENRDEVETVLPFLEDEWPQSVDTVRSTVLTR